jgi:hypothetical protein
MRRMVMPDEVAAQVQAIVDAAAQAEGGCFCLLRAGRGARGVRLLVGDVLAPPADAWDDQHADMLTPSARWISEVVSAANSQECGCCSSTRTPTRTTRPRSRVPIATRSRGSAP